MAWGTYGTMKAQGIVQKKLLKERVASSGKLWP